MSRAAPRRLRRIKTRPRVLIGVVCRSRGSAKSCPGLWAEMSVRSDGEPGAGASSLGSLMRAGRLAIAIVTLAASIIIGFNGPTAAEDGAPLASADRIEDVPSTRADPFPAFDNFAWRAFVAVNWPSLADPDQRGVPDRAKALGDPGPRVWE